ncbi:MAG TPA: hypothetical protein VER11_14145 [Polyangiaceae bacterium]|nr:hypothetical protein [Polyangiaceae bacterium]
MALIAVVRCSAALVLAVPLVAGLLSACGSTSDSNAHGAGTSGSGAGAGIAGEGPAIGGAQASTAGSSSAGAAAASGAAGSESAGATSGTAGRASVGGNANSAAGAGNTGNGGSAGNAGSADNGGSAGFYPWPGSNQVVTVDPVNTYASDLSGLHYEPAQGAAPAVLWAVQNQPSKLYRLLWNGSAWVSDMNSGWASGKTLHFPDGQGAPDSEGVTKGALGSTGLYVSTERDNLVSATSRLSVLLFDDAATSTTLTAAREWNLTSDLPKVGSNLGLEAIAWVPDSYLVAKGFIDESKQQPYDPANYANHGDGIFFVGIEQNGMVYGFALDHVGGGSTRVASIESGHSGVMELSFDRDNGYLWAVCDDTCQGRTNVLDVDTRAGSSSRGKFYVRRGFERPSSMPNLNNEGFTIASESTCQAGFKSVFYAEDGSTMGFAIRRDSIPCGAFLGN